MEYHIMVFQTLCKHFAVPAISQKWFFSGSDYCPVTQSHVGASLLAKAV
jgi:hypothetical protein